MSYGQRRYREKIQDKIGKSFNDDDYSVAGKMFLSGFTTCAVFMAMPNTTSIPIGLGAMGATAVATYNLPKIYHYVKEKIMNRNQDVVEELKNKSFSNKRQKEIQKLELSNEIKKDKIIEFEPFLFQKKEQDKSLIIKKENEKVIERER